MNLETRPIRVNGITLNVLIAGEGPDVLLVHGFPDDHRVWREQIPVLVKAGYRVIAPDSRGCGSSEMPLRVADYKLDQLVADLVGLLDALAIDKVSVVGHDLGAVQAWFLALRHPHRVERLVALSVGHPASYARGGVMQKLKGWYVLIFQLRGFAEWLLTAFDWKGFRALTHCPEQFPEWRATLSPPGRLTAGINFYRANLQLVLPLALPRATVPVHGIFSTGDRYLTERQMRNSGRYVDAAFTYDRIEGVNHWLQLFAPAKVNALLLTYLKQD